MKNKKIWFKAKKYGWYPCSWQGWLIVFVFAVITVFNAFRIDYTYHFAKDIILNFIPQTIILAVIVGFIGYLKGEELSKEKEKRRGK